MKQQRRLAALEPILSLSPTLKRTAARRHFNAAAIAIALVLGAGGAAAECLAEVSASGTAQNNQLLAESRAKENWRDAVKNTSGIHFQHWLKASDKNCNCSHIGKPGRRTWTCKAVAKPCRL